MTPIDQHDLDMAHDLGTLEGKLAAIYDNTKDLPALFAKVEKHDIQLRFILWGGGTTITALLGMFFTWLKGKVLSA